MNPIILDINHNRIESQQRSKVGLRKGRERGRRKPHLGSRGLLGRCVQNGLQVTEEASKGGKCPCNPGESGRKALRMPNRGS